MHESDEAIRESHIDLDWLISSKKRARSDVFDHIIGLYKQPTCPAISNEVAESIKNHCDQRGEPYPEAIEKTMNLRNRGKPIFGGVDFAAANKQNFSGKKSSDLGFNRIFVHCPVETASAADEKIVVLVVFDHWPKVYYLTSDAVQTCAFACYSMFNDGKPPPK